MGGNCVRRWGFGREFHMWVASFVLGEVMGPEKGVSFRDGYGFTRDLVRGEANVDAYRVCLYHEHVEDDDP